MSVKLYLDDERPTPDGWIGCRWPQDVIARMMCGDVEAVSLDHDLGDDEHGTGYDVLLFIEERVHLGMIPPKIYIHTANPAARQRMQAAVHSIHNIYRRMHDA